MYKNIVHFLQSFRTSHYHSEGEMCDHHHRHQHSHSHSDRRNHSHQESTKHKMKRHSPLNRFVIHHLQAVSVGVFAAIFSSAWILLLLLFTPLWFIPVGYLIWYLNDRNTPNHGGRRSTWVRNWTLWKLLGGYFPIKLHKSTELDPDRNYIFGFHPHGVLSYGAYINFGTDTTGFNRLFPYLKPWPLALDKQFRMPIFRDVIMACGIRPATKESISWLLSKEGSGNALVLVTGGALEALDALPHTMDLTLNCRKGFVNLAIKHGADLVPVLSFGENDVFNKIRRNDDSDLIKKVQKDFANSFGFTPIYFWGRGLLPFRKAINTIVGKPVRVTKNECPTRKEVEDLHQLYVESLTELYEEYKGQFGYQDVKLNIK